MANTMMDSEPKMLSRLLKCVSPARYPCGHELQGKDLLAHLVGNAAGAIMNITVESEAACAEILSSASQTEPLFATLPAMREEANVMCHLAGTVANLCIRPEGREMLVAAAGGEGVRLLVQTLESSEDEAQSTACCVALLNACHQHLPSRERMLDCGGVQALVSSLSSENIDLRSAAAGALMNASATLGCAEGIRDASIEFERADGSSGSLSGFELLSRSLQVSLPQTLRARAAGALFNCAAFGPDNRLAMIEAGVIKALATALVHAFSTDQARVVRAPSSKSNDLAFRLQANLIGAALNLALNPTCKAELLRHGVMAPLVEALKSTDDVVKDYASTAIAYLSDKAEPRPGSPISTMTSNEDAALVTKTKLRFHDASAGNKGGAAHAAGGGFGRGSGASAAAHLNASRGSTPPSASSLETPLETPLELDEEMVSTVVDTADASRPASAAVAIDDFDESPGARSKAAIGLMPKAKVSATHDSQSKLARFVQERPETYGRRLTACVEPENIEEPYAEVPSPLPSPRATD